MEIAEAAGHRADHGLRHQRRPEQRRQSDLEAEARPALVIRPDLERIVDAQLDHTAVLELLAKYRTTTALRAAGKERVETSAVQARPAGVDSLGA
ncbi:hypothetical protein [Paeniglutamicibacter sp.]|uniref:hypothetical protein n=1 Tax=Paeniglutamicibacter sp. TaxID=1934391 RepID=UPI0039895838